MGCWPAVCAHSAHAQLSNATMVDLLNATRLVHKHKSCPLPMVCPVLKDFVTQLNHRKTIWRGHYMCLWTGIVALLSESSVYRNYVVMVIVLGAVLWEQTGAWQRETDAYPLWQQGSQLPHHILAASYTASSCCGCCLLPQGKQTNPQLHKFLVAHSITSMPCLFRTDVSSHDQTIWFI